MLPRADLSPVQVARVDPVGRLAPTADPRLEAFQRALAGQVGQSMDSEVLARQTDGSFLVKVAGLMARMELPQSAQVGQQLPLTLVALTPRPTFEVATRQGSQVTVTLSEAHAALPGAAADGEPAPVQKPLSYAASLLARAPLTPSDRLPSIDPNSTPATLSETGRTIATVLNQAAPRAPAALVASVPLTPGPGEPPQRIAAALQQSISESGLFYESHVAEWSNGERPLEALAREPQMARSPAQGKDGQIDAESARFINFQLNTQEQGRVAWEGQPWPGQAMRWEVQREAPERQPHQGAQEQDTPWRSGVRMQFPLLGQIEAKVVLQQGQLHIQVEAGDGETSQLLRQHAERLTAAMEAAGLPLSSLNIRTSHE